MLRSPKVYVDGIEYSEEWKSPGNSIDDYTFSLREELVDDGSKEENMDKRPDEKRPGGRSNISLLAVIVNTLWRSDGIDVRPEEDKVDDDVNDFQNYSIFPGVCHGCNRIRGKDG